MLAAINGKILRFRPLMKFPHNEPGSSEISEVEEEEGEENGGELSPATLGGIRRSSGIMKMEHSGEGSVLKALSG